MRASISRLGDLRPASYADRVAWEVPARRASARWDSPASWRASLMRLPAQVLMTAMISGRVSEVDTLSGVTSNRFPLTGPVDLYGGELLRGRLSARDDGSLQDRVHPQQVALRALGDIEFGILGSTGGTPPAIEADRNRPRQGSRTTVKMPGHGDRDSMKRASMKPGRFNPGLGNERDDKLRRRNTPCELLFRVVVQGFEPVTPL